VRLRAAPNSVSAEFPYRCSDSVFIDVPSESGLQFRLDPGRVKPFLPVRDCSDFTVVFEDVENVLDNGVVRDAGLDGPDGLCSLRCTGRG